MSGILPIIVFMGIASPAMFKTTRRFIGQWIASPEGLATVPGLLVHGFVFVLIMTIIMLFMPRASGYLEAGGMKFVTRDDQDDQNNIHFQKDQFVYAVTG